MDHFTGHFAGGIVDIKRVDDVPMVFVGFVVVPEHNPFLLGHIPAFNQIPYNVVLAELLFQHGVNVQQFSCVFGVLLIKAVVVPLVVRLGVIVGDVFGSVVFDVDGGGKRAVGGVTDFHGDVCRVPVFARLASTGQQFFQLTTQHRDRAFGPFANICGVGQELGVVQLTVWVTGVQGFAGLRQVQVPVKRRIVQIRRTVCRDSCSSTSCFRRGRFDTDAIVHVNPKSIKMHVTLHPSVPGGLSSAFFQGPVGVLFVVAVVVGFFVGDGITVLGTP